MFSLPLPLIPFPLSILHLLITYSVLDIKQMTRDPNMDDESLSWVNSWNLLGVKGSPGPLPQHVPLVTYSFDKASLKMGPQDLCTCCPLCLESSSLRLSCGSFSVYSSLGSNFISSDKPPPDNSLTPDSVLSTEPFSLPYILLICLLCFHFFWVSLSPH